MRFRVCFYKKLLLNAASIVGRERFLLPQATRRVKRAEIISLQYCSMGWFVTPRSVVVILQNPCSYGLGNRESQKRPINWRWGQDRMEVLKRFNLKTSE